MRTVQNSLGLKVEVKDVMVDIEGWLEEGVDVFIEDKYVGYLVDCSEKCHNIWKAIDYKFKETLNHYERQ